MEVTLSPEHAKFARQNVESGEYQSVDDVVEAALQLFQDEHEKLRRLRAALQIGLDQIGRGETVPYTPQLLQQIREESRRMLRKGHTPDPDVIP